MPANHLGEDSAHRHHDPIHAIANGIVRYSGKATGYGRVVVVEHQLPDGVRLCSIYGHLCGHAGYPLTPKGSTVVAGEVVGYIGDAYENGDGREHLHLGIRRGAYDGVFCGYLRRPECTPRHYEHPTPFIERRSGSLTLVAGPLPAAAQPAVGERTSFEATVQNGFHYGGKFELRLRFQPASGEPFFSPEETKRLAPGRQAPLTFTQEFERPGRFAAVLEMRAPGTSAWLEVESSGAAGKPCNVTVATGKGALGTRSITTP